MSVEFRIFKYHKFVNLDWEDRQVRQFPDINELLWRKC